MLFLLSLTAPAFSQTFPVQSYNGVKMYTPDMPFRVMPVYGLNVAEGVDANSTNYVRPDSANSTYPLRRPYKFQNFWTNRNTALDSFFGLSVIGNVQHGGLNSQFGGLNFELIDGTFTANTDGQIGGAIGFTTRHFGHGDGVGYTHDLFCTGVSRGNDEGCEPWRMNTAIHLDLWGITIASVTTDANGQMIFTPQLSSGVPQASANHVLGAVYENGAVINTTPAKTYNTGNVALISSTCPGAVTDTSAQCLSGDTASNWTAKYGVTGITTLTQAIAIPVPATTDVLAKGPFCGAVTVANSAIFTAGSLATISSLFDDTEVFTVNAVGSGTITACFGKAHASGQMMTAGGTAIGHAISFSADDKAAGTLNFVDQGANATTLRLAFPILAVLSGNVIVVQVNGAGSPYNFVPTNGFAANMPSTSPSFTPNLTGGAISSWTVGSTGVQTTLGTGNGGGVTILPPPTISFAGSTCTTLPTAHAVLVRNGGGWNPVTDTAGVGCTSLTTTVQGTTGTPYPNPYAIYPVAWARSNQDPNWTVIAGHDPSLVGYGQAISSSTDGYMLTGGGIAGTGSDGFSVGDTIEETYWPWQRMHDQRGFEKWVMGEDPFSAVEYDHYKGYANGAPMHYWKNEQASADYYGTLANRFSPSFTGTGARAAMTGLEIGGPIVKGISFDQPPRGQPGSEQGNSALFTVNCLDTLSPCANQYDFDWPLFDFEDNNSGGQYFHEIFSPANNQFYYQSSAGGRGKPGLINQNFLTNGNCYSTSSPASCGSAVIGTVQVAAGATSLVINDSAVSINTNSVILLTYNVVGITAPTNMSALVLPYISAINPGVSFTITFPVAPATNAVRVNYAFFDQN